MLGSLGHVDASLSIARPDGIHAAPRRASAPHLRTRARPLAPHQGHPAVKDWLTRRLPGSASVCTRAAPQRSGEQSFPVVPQGPARCELATALAASSRGRIARPAHPSPASRHAVVGRCGRAPTPKAYSTWPLSPLVSPPLGGAAQVPLPPREKCCPRPAFQARPERRQFAGGTASWRRRRCSGAPSWATSWALSSQDI